MLVSAGLCRWIWPGFEGGDELADFFVGFGVGGADVFREKIGGDVGGGFDLRFLMGGCRFRQICAGFGRVVQVWKGCGCGGEEALRGLARDGGHGGPLSLLHAGDGGRWRGNWFGILISNFRI